METITFLAPADPTVNKITKTYRKTATGIEKTSDYDAGYLFNYASEIVPDLETLVTVLTKYRDTHFRIYGHVADNIVAPCRRLNDHFPPAPKGYRWHMLDIDGWEISADLFNLIKPDPANPDSIASLVRALLNNAGLGMIAAADLVILLSASQFDDFSTLRAHVYFQIEIPVPLEEMRQIALAFNKGKTFKVFDHQVYKSVQPDFISIPDCTNFKDPVKQRIFYDESPFGIEEVSEAEWLKFKKETEKNVGHTIDASTKPPKFGKNWLDTLKNHCGTVDSGINEPCYRAAAQMVQEYGNTVILGSLDTYVKRLHDEAWRCINDRGDRGNKDDQTRYDLQKFRSYVKSACDKNFGTESDGLFKRVHDAIEDAAAGNYQPIFDSYVLHAAAKLNSSHPGMYAALRVKIKTDLKGKINLSDWEPQVTSASYAPIEDYKSLLPGGDKKRDGDALPVVDLGKSRDKQKAENQLMIQLMRGYDLIVDQEGMSHLGYKYKNKGVERYELHPVTNELSEFLYYKATMITNGGVTRDFGNKCMSFIRGAARGDDSIFNRIEATVGGRTVQEGPDPREALWLNLGEEEGTPHRCLRISKEGIKWHSCEDSEIKWLPGFAKMEVMSEKDFQFRFQGSTEALIQYYYDNIGKFIASSGDSRTHVTAWCVTALMCRPMPYLAELLGPLQSGKSTAAEFMKDLVDPSTTKIEEAENLNKFKKADSDFFNLVYGQMVTIFDNLSKLSVDDQDSLCGTATGISFNERILYSHNRRKLFVKRPIILTGIEEVVTRPDLNSRTLKIAFSNPPTYQGDMYADWRVQAPIFRRALLEIVQRVISRRATMKDSEAENVLPRDLSFALVTKILRPTDTRSLARISRDLTVSRSIAEAMGDPWVILFIAFLQSNSADSIKDGQSYSGLEISHLYKAWCRANYNLPVQVNIGPDKGSIYTSVRVMVEMNPVQENAVAMGKFLARSIATLNEMSGWNISPVHQVNSVRKRRYNENVSLTSMI